MSQAFAFIIQAGNAVNQLTGGMIIGIVVAFIASVLFVHLVGLVVQKLLNR